jgi:hypothetical protein
MRQLMDAHGPRAIAEAAQRAVESERMKDEDEAQTWRQVEAALKGSRVRSRADRRGRRMPARSEHLGQAGVLRMPFAYGLRAASNARVGRHSPNP